MARSKVEVGEPQQILRIILICDSVRGTVSSDSASLFTEHRRSLVDYAARIVGSRAQAEDVVQEAWLRFDEVARQRLLGEPLAYLYRIVRNLALDGRRRQVREARFVVGQSSNLVAHTPDSRPSPEAEVAGRSDIEALEIALAELPERTRRALELHRFEGKSVKVVAATLGVSVGTAHALIVDGIEHCRMRLYRHQ